MSDVLILDNSTQHNTILVPVKAAQADLVTQKEELIYVPLADRNKLGVVRQGEGIHIENGVVSLDKDLVEGMIDANKWVSYGFRQFLTNEEKGLARHNIGAGDNDFTGSYYDVTQKPWLNTNNTTSLVEDDYETLVDEIKLHKVSKTGSFDDLNDVPKDTINFAEEERQKSKNLLITPYQSGSKTENGLTFTANEDGSIHIQGTASATTYYTFVTSPNFVHLKNEVYSLSLRDTNNQIVPSIRLELWHNGDRTTLQNGYGYITNTFVEADYNDIYMSISKNTVIDTTIYPQLELGEITEWQEYNGVIVRKKDIRTLNTLNKVVSTITTLPKEYQQVEYIESTGTQYIDTGIIGNENTEFEIDFISNDNNDNARYGCVFGVRESSTIREFQLSSFTSGANIGLFRKFNRTYNPNLTVNERHIITLHDNILTTDNTNTVSVTAATFTTPTSITLFGLNTPSGISQNGKVVLYSFKLYQGKTLVRDYVPCYRKSDNVIGLYDVANDVFYTNNGTGVFLKGQNIYTTNTVKKQDIADVEHIETIYDMSSTDSNINKGYTSGLMATGAQTTYNMGLLSSKYKAYIIHFRLNDSSVSTKVTARDGWNNFSVACGDYYGSRYGISTYVGRILDTGYITGVFANYIKDGAGQDKNNDPMFIITRIEGVLL